MLVAIGAAVLLAIVGVVVMNGNGPEEEDTMRVAQRENPLSSRTPTREAAQKKVEELAARKKAEELAAQKKAEELAAKLKAQQEQPQGKKDWKDLLNARIKRSDQIVFAKKRAEMVALMKARDDEGLFDKSVLKAMSEIPMELFYPSSGKSADQLYGDLPVFIGFDETISQPSLTLAMLTYLSLSPGHKVLELKTASGYQTALMAHMGAEVYSLETDRALGRIMKPTINSLGFNDLHYVVGGNAYAGLPDNGPFDRIIATAAYPTPPFAILEQLKPGGRFIGPVNDGEEGQFLMLYTKTETGSLRQLKLLPVSFSQMPH
jgi:protein-L-isoaspartate(D-aspartate) O-methyltransferase